MSATATRDWFGHPRGLAVLFLTETWEKFSFFGMKALLIYYMVGTLQFPQPKASLVFGLYTGCTYLTPIFGGVIADRWLGHRRAVLVGGTVMAFGHFLLADEALLYPALCVIALGNGLFLPSLGGQVVGLYAPGDRRLPSAYNIYYAGINLGGFLAPLCCGWIGETYGWHWGFATAGVAMLAGVVIYAAGSHLLPQRNAHRPRPSGSAAPTRARVAVLAAVFAIVVLFRGAYEQSGNALAIWIGQHVDRGIGGGKAIPMTWFQACDPLLVLVLTPLLLRFWRRLGRDGREPAQLIKMSIGALLVGGAFLLLTVLSLDAAEAGTRVGWAWVLLFFFVYTLGELCILPVGLSLFGRLAPQKFEATMIAAWFAAAFVGNFFAGFVGMWSPRVTSAAFFAALAALCALAASLLLLLARSSLARRAID